METIEQLKRQIKTATDLHSLVRTMKALAAVNIRHLEQAVESLEDYNRTIERGLQIVMRDQQFSVPANMDEKVARTVGIIVFGSDQGMCGALNDQVVEFARHRMASLLENNIAAVWMAVGHRVAIRLEDAGISPDAVLPIAGSTQGITGIVHEILLTIDQWHQQKGVHHLNVFFSEHLSKAAYQTQQLRLLPLDHQWLAKLRHSPWPGRSLPTYTMNPSTLFSALIRQFLFVSLYRACAESMASENASRLAAMRGAERNIGDRIKELTTHYHHTRQMSITEELLDIASGFEALMGDGK